MAALFAAGRPLSIEELGELFEQGESLPKPDQAQLELALTRISERLDDLPVDLHEVASGYRFEVPEQYSHWVNRLWVERPARYSRAVLETLALIAYKQPITRPEIEHVRGVSVGSNIVRTLMDRGWIRVVGHRDAPGRPALYGTTHTFLDYFGLRSLEELPTLAEIRDLTEIEPELPLAEKSSPSGANGTDGRREGANAENPEDSGALRGSNAEGVGVVQGPWPNEEEDNRFSR